MNYFREEPPLRVQISRDNYYCKVHQISVKQVTQFNNTITQ